MSPQGNNTHLSQTHVGVRGNEADLEEVTLVREPEATLTAPRHNLLAIEHIVRMAILNVRLENSRSNR